ncbi:MAG: DUF305 domain-containing protein [Pseudomonadota bacterium]
MKRCLRLPSFCYAALATAVFAASSATAEDRYGPPHHPRDPAVSVSPADDPDRQTKPGMMSKGSSQMHQMHMSMMQNMPQMTGDTDQDFAMMMKHHHEQAIKMAEIEAAQGKSPELKAMAKKMMEAQKQEIKKLEDWLSKNKK